MITILEATFKPFKRLNGKASSKYTLHSLSGEKTYFFAFLKLLELVQYYVQDILM